MIVIHFTETGWMDAWDGWMDEWMDGWIDDILMDGWMDGWPGPPDMILTGIPSRWLASSR